MKEMDDFYNSVLVKATEKSDSTKDDTNNIKRPGKGVDVTFKQTCDKITFDYDTVDENGNAITKARTECLSSGVLQFLYNPVTGKSDFETFDTDEKIKAQI